MANLDLSALDELPEINLSALDELPEVDEKKKPFLATPQPPPEPTQEGSGYFDVLHANLMRGISNSITFDPESNFQTVKNIIPEAELRSVQEISDDGSVTASPVIFVPDPNTKEMIPLTQAGGFLGEFVEASSSSLRPIIGMLAPAVAGAKAGATLGSAGGPVGAVAGGAIGGLGSMALASLLGTTAFDGAMTTVGGVKDKRDVLDQLSMVGEEFVLDVAGGKLFEALPSFIKSTAKAPFKASGWIVNFLSKFGLAPKPEQLSIARAVKGLQNKIGEKSAKEILRIMNENEVPYPLALEVLGNNNTIRGFVEKTMKNPFGNTLYNAIEDARIATESSAFNLPKKFKKTTPLSRQEVGELVSKEIPKVYKKRQEVQSLLRDSFQKDLNSVLNKKGTKKVSVIDLAESIKDDAKDFISTPLGDNKSYKKVDLFLKKNVTSEILSKESGIQQGSFSSAIMDLSLPSTEAKEILKSTFKRKESADSINININDLFEIEKTARDAYRKRYLRNGGKEDELSFKLKNFRNKVTDKLNKEIVNLSPELMKKKSNYDSQWAKDTEMIEKGVGTFQQYFRNPEEIVDIAKSQLKIGGTRIKNIRNAFKQTDPSVWNELRTSIIDTMGKSGKDDKYFSLTKWNNEYSSFSKEAKEVLFGDVPNLVKQLDDFSELALLAKERQLNTNPSGTSQAEGFRIALEKFLTSPIKQAGISAGNYLNANLMASPRFVKIISDGINPKNLKIVRENGLEKVKYKDINYPKKMMRQLTGLATSNAYLRDDINKFIEHLQSKVLYELSDAGEK